MEHKPNYYAVIPAEVRYNKSLSPRAILLYGEISALAQKEGYCWATNAYFAELYEVSPITISRLISQLCKHRHIATEVNQEAGNERKIYLSSAQVLTKMQQASKQKRNEGNNKNVKTPINENVKHNNTSINSTKNNKKEEPFLEISKAKYEIQNDHKTPEKLASLTRWSIENAVQQVRQLYGTFTGKQLSEADAQRWLELSAVGKHIDVSKCEFTSSGDVIETNLRQWLLNSAKYALQNGKFTLPAPQRTNAPAQNRTSVFD